MTTEARTRREKPSIERLPRPGVVGDGKRREADGSQPAEPTEADRNRPEPTRADETRPEPTGADGSRRGRRRRALDSVPPSRTCRGTNTSQRAAVRPSSVALPVRPPGAHFVAIL